MYNSIEIAGKIFPIEGSVSLEFYSPFNDGEEINIAGENLALRGDFVLPFTIEGGNELAEVTGQAQLLQSSLPTVEFENCVMRSNGITVSTGKVQMQRITENLNKGRWNAECIISGIPGEFRDLIGDTTLKQLHLHDDINIQGSNFRKFFGDGGTDIFHNAFPTEYDVTTDSGKIVEFRVKRGFNIWRYIDDNYTDDYLQDTSFYATQINNGIEPDEGHPIIGYFCFPTYQADFDRSFGDSCEGKFNKTFTAPGTVYLGFDVEIFDSADNDYAIYTPLRNQIVPMYFMHKILRHCFENFGFTLSGELLDDPQFLKMIMPNTYSILREEVLQVNNMFGTGGTGYQLYWQAPTVISSQNHLPDMTVIDFILDIMLKFQVAPIFNGNSVTLKSNKLKKSQKDFSSIDPEIIIEHPSGRGFTAKYEFSKEDGSYEAQRNFTEVISKDIKESVDLSIVPDLVEDEKFIENNRNAIKKKATGSPDDVLLVLNNLVPYNTGKVKQFISQITPVEMGEFNYTRGTKVVAAYLPWFKHDPSYYDVRVYEVTCNYNSFLDTDIYTELVEPDAVLNEGVTEKKCALFHGMQNAIGADGLGFLFPYMSFHNYAPADLGDVKLGDWHLGWLGEEGLMETHWGRFANIYNLNRRVYMKVFENWYELRKLNNEECITVRGKDYYLVAVKCSMPELALGAPAVFETYQL